MSRLTNGDANGNRLFALFALVLGFSLTTAMTAWAQPLSDSQEPGSVLVFPLFEGNTTANGTISAPADAPYGATTLPVSSFEVSVVCPNGATCTDQQDVDIKFEWVCGAEPCTERNFVLNTTVNGTIRFNTASTHCAPGPSSLDPQGCGTVSRPACKEGFLIGWVVDEANRPIKFDGLIGDAVIREPSAGSNAVTAYNAIPIQAAPAVANLALIPGGSTGLRFNGTSYTAVTGTIIGSVQLDFVNAAGADQDKTSLILLTLDTLSNRFNYPVDVDLNFYNEREEVASDHFQFVCFGDTGPLFSTFGLETSYSPETLKTLVQSTKAVKTPVFGIKDTAGPVTLLGLVITREFDATGTTLQRHFAYPLLNDSIAVATKFVP